MRTLAILSLAGLLSVFGQARKSARQGEKQFRAGQRESAVKAFADAAGREPNDPLWKFDLGTARGGGNGRADLEAAARSDDPEVAAAASYQLGTLDLQSKDYGAAARNLRRALELRPGKPDAKRNLEIALRKAAEAPPKGGQGKPQSSPGASAPRSPSAGKPQSSGQKPRDGAADREFEKQAGMARSQAEALLRSLDDEQKQRERSSDRASGKDW